MVTYVHCLQVATKVGCSPKRIIYSHNTTLLSFLSEAHRNLNRISKYNRQNLTSLQKMPLLVKVPQLFTQSRFILSRVHSGLRLYPSYQSRAFVPPSTDPTTSSHTETCNSLSAYQPDRPCRRFTPEEDAKLLRLRARGMTFREIGKKVGRSPASLAPRHEKLVKPPTVEGRWSAAEDQALRKAKEAAERAGERRWLSAFSRSIGRSPTAAHHRLLMITSAKRDFVDPALSQVFREVERFRQEGRPIPWAKLGKEVKRNPSTLKCLWIHSQNHVKGSWSVGEDTLLQEYAAAASARGMGIPYAQVGRRLGRTQQAVRGRWKTLTNRVKMGRSARDKYTKAEERQIMEFASRFAGQGEIPWEEMKGSRQSPKALRCKYSILKKKGLCN